VAGFGPLLDLLAEVPDPRRAQGKLYSLPHVLLFSILAIVVARSHRPLIGSTSRCWLQHAKQAASGLSTDTPGRMQAKAAIVAEVERLHWRIWKGKAKNARHTLERVRKVMHVFQGESFHRAKAVPSSRKLWHALREVDKYLRSQSTRLVNYAKRYRAGLRVGTSVTEGTANFLVNRRMNKQQQMRWSRRGADLLLQVRCAVYNGARTTLRQSI
jgi:hypothetical protein